MFSQAFKKYVKHITVVVKKYIPLIIILQLMLLGTSLLGIYLADRIQELLDTVFIVHDLSKLWTPVLKIIVICLPIYIINIGSSFLNSFISNRVIYKVRYEFYRKMQLMDYNFFSKTSRSEIYYRMFSDVNSIVSYYLEVVISLPIQIVFIIILFWKLLDMSPYLTGYAVILLAIQIVAVLLFKKPVKHIIERQKSSEQNVIYKVNEQLTKIDMTKVLGIEKFQLQQFDNTYKGYMKLNIKNTFLLKLFKSITEFINQFWFIGALVIGAVLIHYESLTIGGLLAFNVLAQYLFNPVLKMINTIISYQDCKTSYIRFFDYYIPSSGCNKTGDESFCFLNEIYFTNITFCYNKDVFIFNNASMQMKAGDFVAIKGPSGIGKTTLFRIMAQLLQVNSGSITIDGVNIADINRDEYLQEIGLLLQ